ncbi:MAG: glycosyltransferase family 4 protein, partial [Bacillota bacterium]|nr:glycosyltransferase family 4 protein [Bacillota bacterium]
SNHVEFLGSLPHHDAMREMAECDVFVLPSWKEAFGIVYLEAMAHGKPIIGTLGEGISEIFAQEDVGIAVPPKDVSALTKGIRELFRHQDKAREMGARGKDLVYRKFTWRYNAQQTHEVYLKAMRKSKGNSGQS